MKEINVFIRSGDLSKVADSLLKHKAGITFFEINGTGRTPSAASEIVGTRMTGRTSVPKFVNRTMVILLSRILLQNR
jgi:nitrogen regulatory protein P-II 1